jgi:ribonuclease Z
MAEILFLGTANAVSDKGQENTHLLISAGDKVMLVDCGGNPVSRLDQAGINAARITDLILTHFHPDHVSGLPLLLMDLWLMGRQDTLNIYGLGDVIDRVIQMMNLFNWQDWNGFYPVVFHRVPAEERMLIINDDAVQVWTSPTCHSIPSIGMRFAFEGGAVSYSSDTAPCDAMVRLAEKVDILVHEAAGDGYFHSSPVQAGEIAQRAGAGKLVLVHYATDVNLEEWVRQAERSFTGEVTAAKDWMTITI